MMNEDSKKTSSDDGIAVSGVTLNKNNTSILVSSSEKIYATIEPADAENRNIDWSSDNELVAIVNNEGLVGGLIPGTAVISVTTEDGGFIDTCTVTVSAQPINVAGVSLNKTSMNLDVGSTGKLDAMIYPSNATNQNLTWESNDNDTATVDETGSVSAIAGGSATIMVTTDGGYTATCNVRVNWVTGNKITYSADDIDYTMVYVSGGHAFPVGINDNGDITGDGTQDVPPIATITNAYWIAETELTYELWATVYEWAVNGAGDAPGEGMYTFANQGGRGGYINGGYVPYNNDHEKHPVTMINWRDTMVWCNALTEYFNTHNGTDDDLECVYYSDASYTSPIRVSTNDAIDNPLISGAEDQPYIKAIANGNIVMNSSIANGFRLPTLNEWELAARYRGSDTINTVQATIGGIDFTHPLDGIYWTRGNSASGATLDYTNSTASGLVAIYGDNSGASSAEVKSKGLTGANALGLYDMCGNVWESCFDWIPGTTNQRVWRAGSWSSVIDYIRIGQLNGSDPSTMTCGRGIRIVRSAD